MGSPGVHITLDTILTQCRCLSSLLEAGYGPNALSTLLSTSTGKVLVTSCGATIIHTMHLSGHPVGHLISSGALTHHRTTGDGAKAFVLLLEAIVEELTKDEAFRFHGQDLGSSAQREAVERCAFATAFAKLKNGVVQGWLIPEILKCAPVCRQHVLHTDKDGMETTCNKLIVTFLSGRYPKDTTEHLAGLLCQLVFPECNPVSQLQETIQVCIDNFLLICVENVGSPPIASSILPGVVIRRDFLVHHSELFKMAAPKFVLLGFTLEEEEGPNQVTISVSGQESLLKNLTLKSEHIQALCLSFQQLGVNLILSSEKIGESMCFACKKAGISVVHMIPEEEMEELSLICDVFILQTARDLVELPQSRIVGSAEACRVVVASGHRYLYLKGVSTNVQTNLSSFEDSCQNGHCDYHRDGRQVRPFPHRFIVCAPTQGMCKQLTADMQNALQSLLIWLDAEKILCVNMDEKLSSENPAIQNALTLNESTHEKESSYKVCMSVPSGGFFEILVHKLLSSYSKSCSDIYLKKTCNVVKNAILKLPLTLLKNSFCGNNKKTKCNLLQKISQGGPTENSHFVINGRSGEVTVQGLGGTDHMEPLASKLLLLQHVFELVQQLLRMEMVVSVHSLSQQGDCLGSDQDSD